MNEQLTKDKQKQDSYKQGANVVPKIFVNPLQNYVSVNQLNNGNVAPPKPAQKNERRINSEHNEDNGKNYVGHYADNFHLPPSRINNSHDVNASSRRNIWLYLAIAVVGLLLIANLMFVNVGGINIGGLPQTTNPQTSQENDASLEFETVVPLAPHIVDNEVMIDNETMLDGDGSLPSKSHIINVPKRRVLVISEQARKELLQQLQAPELPPSNIKDESEHIYEYYRK